MTPSSPRAHPLTEPRWPAALAGVVATAAALAAAELLAGLVDRVPSLVVAVGDVVIDSVPGWLERAATSTLGTADKPVLLTGIVVVAALVGAGLGVLARRRFPAGVVGFALAGAAGVAAEQTDPRASLPWTIGAALLAVLVGVAVLHRLLGRAAAVLPAGGSPRQQAVGRRSFLIAAGSAAALAAVGGIGGWLLSSRARLEDLRATIRLPAPARAAAVAPAGASLDIAWVSPLYTPNDAFYRIDTALRVPNVDPASWRLDVRGLVDRPFTLTYDEIMAMPQVEVDVTLACVSNEVGGDLVGNARWQGVPLRSLLERAGVRSGATQLIGRSVDGFTAGFPTRIALDGDALLAVGMNGAPLPIDHGFPARLVVPGLYGYVSATKWLSAIELTSWDVDGYWIPRGWAKEGPIKTQTRIDVPRDGATVAAGRRAIAGVAWAPTRGIQRVEVRVDDGPWTDAELAEPIGDDTWRQWYLPWDAPAGDHRITARATDGRGEVQSEQRTPVAPDGASGYPSVQVGVDPA